MNTAKYQLIITHNQTTERFVLNNQKPLKLKAKKNTVYQIVDETGEVVLKPIIEAVGDDAYVYLPNDGNVSLILEEFQDLTPITDPTALSDLNASLATQSDGVATPFWKVWQGK